MEITISPVLEPRCLGTAQKGSLKWESSEGSMMLGQKGLPSP